MIIHIATFQICDTYIDMLSWQIREHPCVLIESGDTYLACVASVPARIEQNSGRVC